MNFLWIFKRPGLKTPLKVCIGCKDYFLKQTYSLLVSPPKIPNSLQRHIAPWKSHEPPQQDTSGTECAFCASYRKIRRRKSGRNGLGQSGQWLRARLAFVYETAPTGSFSTAASWWGLRSPYPHIVQNHMILPIGGLLQQVTAGVQMHCRGNQTFDFGKETPCHERRKKWNLS